MSDDTLLRFKSRKLVSERLDFPVDLSARLQDGETISSVVWSAPASFQLTNQTTDNTGAVVWIAGGTAGRHIINIQATTSAGRTVSENIVLMVENG